MKRPPRLFPSELDPARRWVYGAVAAFYVVLFVALIWPAYTLFSGIRPLVLGMPLSLFYVVTLVVLSFLVLLGLYLWEGRRDRTDPGPGDEPAGSAEDRPRRTSRGDPGG